MTRFLLGAGIAGEVIAAIVTGALVLCVFAGCGDSGPVPRPPPPNPQVAETPADPKKVRKIEPLLRFDGQSGIELDRTEALFDLNKDFTIELLVHVDGTGYLAGDEIWPAMHAEAPAVSRASGWVLRKFARDGLEWHQKRVRYDFTAAVEGDEWLRIVTFARRESTPWRHVAVSRSGNRLRVFLDGELSAVKSCDGVTFVNSPTPMYLGVRRFAPQNRRLSGDLKAARISSTGRYTRSFSPPASLESDDHTLGAWDATAGSGEIIPDRSGHDHAGRLFGVKWTDTDADGPQQQHIAMPVDYEQYALPLAKKPAGRVPFHEVRVHGTFEGGEVLTVRRERTQFFPKEMLTSDITLGGVPLTRGQTIKGASALLDSGETRHLPAATYMDDFGVVLHEGRGRVRYLRNEWGPSTRWDVVVEDPEPGSDRYDFTLRFGLRLPEWKLSPEATAALRKHLAEGRRSLPGKVVRNPMNRLFPRRYRLLYDSYGGPDPGIDDSVRAYLERVATSLPLLYQADVLQFVSSTDVQDATDVNLPLLQEAGADLLEAGCTDPLVTFCHGQQTAAALDWKAADAMFASAEQQFAKSKYPRWCAALAGVERARLALNRFPQAPESVDRMRAPFTIWSVRLPARRLPWSAVSCNWNLCGPSRERCEVTGANCCRNSLRSRTPIRGSSERSPDAISRSWLGTLAAPVGLMR